MHIFEDFVQVEAPIIRAHVRNNFGLTSEIRFPPRYSIRMFAQSSLQSVGLIPSYTDKSLAPHPKCLNNSRCFEANIFELKSGINLPSRPDCTHTHTHTKSATVCAKIYSCGYGRLLNYVS